MKKTFILMALSSATILSADQYGQSYGYQSGYYPSCNQGGYSQGGYNQSRQYSRGGYNQEGPDYGNGYNQGQYQGQYQGHPNHGNYRQQNGSYSQQNTPYNSQQQSYRQNQQSGQIDSYSQQQNTPYYYQDQQGMSQNANPTQNESNKQAVSDEEITKKIRNILISDWFSKGFQSVTFNVYNGKVNLRGSVESEKDKNKIEESVKKIDGVNEVHNEISIVKAN